MILDLWRSRDAAKQVEFAKLQKENAKLKDELKVKDETIAKLEEKLEKISRQRDKYCSMIFKKNIDSDENDEQIVTNETNLIPAAATKEKKNCQVPIF